MTTQEHAQTVTFRKKGFFRKRWEVYCESKGRITLFTKQTYENITDAETMWENHCAAIKRDDIKKVIEP